ncbi:phosphopantothenoylcysteine decarboxylase subunit VHS3-like [Lathyrus oleraceus]|uniref:phosphopantothenoylcysteine decarboxylase subunit VHS3-like n=1 Tax=Pisum sativum TaxID=3888 RepID=UPI0021D0B9C5|nr:phosphopantothenoylcysteine decarboxylase subunit VHS3-like [Pisum sativum]
MAFSYVHSFERYETQLNFFAYLTYFLDISKKNAGNRSKQKFMHRVEPTNFARIHAKLRAKKDGEEVTQAEMFIETRKSRKGKQVDGETQFAIDKLQESIENSVEAGTQAFQSLFGKEKPGRVRNKDDPQDEQDDDLQDDDNLQYNQDDDDLQYGQDDDDLQYDQDDNDLQYDNFQDDDSHEPQHNEYDKDRH